MSTDQSWISELFVRIGNYANARIDREYDQTTVILEDIRQLVMQHASPPAGDMAREEARDLVSQYRKAVLECYAGKEAFDLMISLQTDLILALSSAPAAPAQPDAYIEGGRESVEDALDVVESFGPGTAGVNDTFARQILLAAEVKRLRSLYEMAVKGRSDFRNALRDALAAAPVAEPANDDIRDALRFRFLCHDHDDAEMRALIGALLQRMWVMSLSAVRADIDVLMGPADRHPPTPGMPS